MLDELNNLTLLQPDCQWKVLAEGNFPARIIQVLGVKHSFRNLVNFIQCVKLANSILLNDQTMTAQDIDNVFRPLADTSIKLQISIGKLNAIHRLILSGLQIAFTGTTLVSATEKLEHIVVRNKHLENTYAAKIAYPQLMKDAEYALSGRAAYVEVAERYILPRRVYDAMEHPRGMVPCKNNFINPLLYHMRQAIVTECEWLKDKIQAGRQINEDEVMDHCDIAMQVALMLTQLALRHELDLAYHKALRAGIQPIFAEDRKNYTHFLGSQSCYSYWVLITSGNLYKWIRSYPCYNKVDRWYSGVEAHRPFIEGFYQPHTRQSLWTNAYNELCRLIPQIVDTETFYGLDTFTIRFEDTPDLMILPNQYGMLGNLRGAPSQDLFEKDC